MKVRLLTRWNGYVSNDIVSVSEARAEMLESQGIGRIIDRPATVEAPEAPVEALAPPVDAETPVESEATEAEKPEPKARKK